MSRTSKWVNMDLVAECEGRQIADMPEQSRRVINKIDLPWRSHDERKRGDRFKQPIHKENAKVSVEIDEFNGMRIERRGTGFYGARG